MITKVLVTVMTFPTLSSKYLETVCTAGFKEDGSWIRIFPVPYRLLQEQYDQKTYSKWQWIEADLRKNVMHDDRPESYHIEDINSLKILKRIDVKGKPNWSLRLEWTRKNKVYTDLSEVIKLTYQGEMSLAVFKPAEILGVICKKEDVDKYTSKLQKLQKLQNRYSAQKCQQNMYEDKNTTDYNFKFARQIPYKFQYRFKDCKGTEHTIKIIDWEIYRLYEKCLKLHSGNIEQAFQDVRQKYMSFANERDLYFFLGTSYKSQKMNYPNPYLIIGVFAPPRQTCIEPSFDF